ncbi:Demethylsterigmatocystin 6-O-methyltransferase [Cytospora mali]|uniref:Demethylsterigmatocystin 6-O-methyltransferase n=1 Tax=Cytospora mali TaxID=578113 RepID=A0A194UUR3_CYTMA|nr:Demethylsterigmatocystin 6-O-methyltransferase [Valsa mali var. pyri (nom. inval.)]
MPALTIDPPVATPQPKGKGAVPDAVKRAVEAKVYGYFYSFVEMGVVKTFIDHQIFQALPADGSDIAIADLAAKTSRFDDAASVSSDSASASSESSSASASASASDSNVNLLERFCNYLIASDVLSQGSAPRRVAHGRTSRFFLDEGVALMFSHLFENCLLPVAHWPEYFETNGFAEPRQANVTPWGLSWGYPDKTNYEVFAMFPEKALPFNASMKVGVQDMPITGMYDFSWIGEYASASGSSLKDRERTLLVDVGGGMGQALKAILAENQDIPPWRCALQDRPETIVEVKKEADPALAQVQKFGASFHGEEPVKGALVYHIRRVLNDWPDDDVVNIFGQIRAACAPDSRVLVSEQLVPDSPSLMMGALDIFMMNFGGKRRNERQYGELAERAGFRLSSVSRHGSSDSAVIELVVA